MLNKYEFITIMEGECCKIINVNVVSQCNRCHHTILDVFRRFNIYKWKINKEGSKLLLTFNMINILVSNMRGVRFC